MGSQFSSHIDRAGCAHKQLFEPWPIVAVAGAACRTLEVLQAEQKGKAARAAGGAGTGTAAAGGPGRGLKLREAEIQRVQFHDIFVDSSYMLPVLARSVDKGMEFTQNERAADARDRGEELPHDEGEEAARARERTERITALTSTFKGLKDEVFDVFVPNAVVPRQFGGRFGAFGGLSDSGKETSKDDVADDPPELQNIARIRALDVLVVLTIMCKGTPAQKLSLLYTLFSETFVWTYPRVTEQVWLYARTALDCADCIRCKLTGEQLHDLLLTAGVAMRRVGISVADVPFSASDLELAQSTLPKGGTLALVKRPTRGARRFKAALNIIRNAIRAGIVESILRTGRRQSTEAGADADGGAGGGGVTSSLAMDGLKERIAKGGFATLVAAAKVAAGKAELTTTRDLPSDDSVAKEEAAAEAAAAAAASGRRRPGLGRSHSAGALDVATGLAESERDGDGEGGPADAGDPADVDDEDAGSVSSSGSSSSGGSSTVSSASTATPAKAGSVGKPSSASRRASVESASARAKHGAAAASGTAGDASGHGSGRSANSTGAAGKPSRSSVVRAPAAAGAGSGRSATGGKDKETPRTLQTAASFAGVAPAHLAPPTAVGPLSDDDRLVRLRQLYCENLDDDSPGVASFVMVKRINEAEEAATTSAPGFFPPSKTRFKFARVAPFLVNAATGQAVDPAAAGQAAGALRGKPVLRRAGSASHLETGEGSPAADAGSRSPAPLARSGTLPAGLGLGGGVGAGASLASLHSGTLSGGPSLAAAGSSTAGPAIDHATYTPSDSEWTLALAASFFAGPERWRRITAARKRAIANIPGGRTLRAGVVMWDYYAAADATVTQAATELGIDLQEARACVSAHNTEKALMWAAGSRAGGSPMLAGMSAGAPGAVPDLALPASLLGSGPSAGVGGGAGSGAASGAGAGSAALGGAGGVPVPGSPGARSVSFAGVPGSPLPGSSGPGGLPPGTIVRTVTDSHASTAQDIIRRLDGLFAAPVSAHLFFDWMVTHPVPRYIMRQLAFSMGRVATYDGLEQDIPPADARHKLKTANPTAHLSKAEQTRLLARLIQLTGLTIADLRPMRARYIASTATPTGMTQDQFRRFFGDFISDVGQSRKEAAMMHSLQKAKRDEALASGMKPGAPGWPEGVPLDLPPPPLAPPAFVSMTEPQKKKLLTKLFSVFDVNGDNTVDLAEFSVGVSRVMHGSAVDKLSLIFDVYDGDGDGSVSNSELTSIMLRALNLAEETQVAANDTRDDAERRQDDLTFASELADALDVNGDGDISREEFFQVLRAEPLMYECFAASLGLTIGGLDVEDGMDLATAAKTGPIFDFKMLRLIRDQYSIDITKNRGHGHSHSHAKSGGGAGDDSKRSATAGTRDRSGSGGSDDSFSLMQAGTVTRHGGGRDHDDDEEGSAAGGAGADVDGDDDDEDDDKATTTTRGSGSAGGKRKGDGGTTSILERAVDRHHFRRLLRDVWKCPEDALFLSDRIFEFLDEDRSGSIDVRELYSGITSALRGDAEHRANFFYNLFDTEGLGHMKSDQILRMLLAGSGREDVSEDDARAVLAKIDADGSGTVEREEFLDAVAEDPGIIDSLSRIFGMTGGAASTLLAARAGDEALDGESQEAHDADGRSDAGLSSLPDGGSSARSADGAAAGGAGSGAAGDDEDEDGVGGGDGAGPLPMVAGSLGGAGSAASPAGEPGVTNRRAVRMLVRQGSLVMPSGSVDGSGAGIGAAGGPAGGSPVMGVTANRRNTAMARRSVISPALSVSPSPSRADRDRDRGGDRDGFLGGGGSVGSVASASDNASATSPFRRQSTRPQLLHTSSARQLVPAAAGESMSPSSGSPQRGAGAVTVGVLMAEGSLAQGSMGSMGSIVLEGSLSQGSVGHSDGDSAGSGSAGSSPHHHRSAGDAHAHGQTGHAGHGGILASLVSHASETLHKTHAAEAASEYLQKTSKHHQSHGHEHGEEGSHHHHHHHHQHHHHHHQHNSAAPEQAYRPPPVPGFGSLLSLTSHAQGHAHSGGSASSGSSTLRRMMGQDGAGAVGSEAALAHSMPPPRRNFEPGSAGAVVVLPSSPLRAGVGAGVAGFPGGAGMAVPVPHMIPLAGGLAPPPPASGGIYAGAQFSLLPPGSGSSDPSADRRMSGRSRSRSGGASRPSSPNGRPTSQGQGRPGTGDGGRGKSIVPPLALVLASGGGSDDEDDDGEGSGSGHMSSTMRTSVTLVQRSKAAVRTLTRSIAETERLQDDMRDAREASNEAGADGLNLGAQEDAALLAQLRAGLSTTGRKLGDALGGATGPAAGAKPTPRKGGPGPGLADLKGSLPGSQALGASPGRAGAPGAGGTSARRGSITARMPTSPQPGPAHTSGSGSPLPTKPSAGVSGKGGKAGAGAGRDEVPSSALAVLQAAATLGARSSVLSMTGSVASAASAVTAHTAATMRSSVLDAGAGSSGLGGRGGNGGAGKGKGRKRGPFVHPDAEGPARWYRKDPEVTSLLRTAMASAKDMEVTYGLLVTEKNGLGDAERTAMSHVTSMLLRRKVRELAERRAELARMMTEAATGSGEGGAGLATGALIAGAGGGFVSGASLRGATGPEELPLAIQEALHKSAHMETTLSGAALADPDLAAGGVLGQAEVHVPPAPPLLPSAAGGASGPAGMGGGALAIRSPMRAGSPALLASGGHGSSPRPRSGGRARSPLTAPPQAGAPAASGTADLSAIAARQTWRRAIAAEVAAEAASGMHPHAHSSGQHHHDDGAYDPGLVMGHHDHHGHMGHHEHHHHGHAFAFAAEESAHQPGGGYHDGPGHSYHAQHAHHGVGSASEFVHPDGAVVDRGSESADWAPQHPQQRSYGGDGGARWSPEGHGSAHGHGAASHYGSVASSGPSSPYGAAGRLASADQGEVSQARFPVPVSAVANTHSPLLVALGVRPSALRTQAGSSSSSSGSASTVKYPLPSPPGLSLPLSHSARLAPGSPGRMGASSGRVLVPPVPGPASPSVSSALGPASPAGFAASAVASTPSRPGSSQAHAQARSLAGGATVTSVDGVRPSPANRAAGQMLMASPSRL